MTHIQNKTPRSTDAPVQTPEQPGARGSSKSAKTAPGSPRLREQPVSPKTTLLSPSARQAGCTPPASPRDKLPAPGSPYKPPSSSADGPVPGEPASPRAYLLGLKPDNLANSIFRDQTTANARTYPAAWLGLVQASLEETVGRLLALAPTVLAAMPKKDLSRLYPEVGCDEGFEWKPFSKLCARLWPHFSEQVISLDALPRRTLGLLAQLHAELAGLPGFLALEPDARDKVMADALFNVLIWNGIFSPLTGRVPEQYHRLVNGLCTYVKAAWGIRAQTQGSLGQAIVSMVPAEYVDQARAFRSALAQQVEKLAALRTASYRDAHGDPAQDRLREMNIDRHFTDTWLGRADDYAMVVRQGNYHLTNDDGVERRCRSYRELSEYVGTGSKSSLPQVVLHVAGSRISNFLCNTYLYDPAEPLFTDARGNRVDPMPNLKTKFVLSRNGEGRITVAFSCVDHAVKLAMLVGPGADSGSVEAVPLFQASLEFRGRMHFYPNEEFEAGHIAVTGRNFHMFE